MNVFCAPASLKEVLYAEEAARHLAEGVEAGGGEALELPVADGGDGTAAVLFRALGGNWHEATVDDPPGRPVAARSLVLPDRTAVVEIAEAAGLGLEELLPADAQLRPCADLPGAGAAGGLGAGFAAPGGTLRGGAVLVLETLRFRDRLTEATLIVSGEGQVDRTTLLGKARGRSSPQAHVAGIAAVLFGGIVASGVLSDARLIALSGDPQRAARDLVELGRTLAAAA